MELLTVSHMSEEDIIRLVKLHQQIAILPTVYKHRTLRRLARKLGIPRKSCMARTISSCFSLSITQEESLSQFIASMSFTLKATSMDFDFDAR
ncbi:hypothetical protein AAMO2058_000634900 [Amorphochlora amoebiformis]|mmetsp:Transcript_17666/g.28163  ORF Transcript_17666/g.28163 Transcript_17666/m.28163 type:complete len:93 (-) Transcript_17666:527-805(-)|eukprot:1386000-Amorphochlora_amoeboformis.AAC.1